MISLTRRPARPSQGFVCWVVLAGGLFLLLPAQAALEGSRSSDRLRLEGSSVLTVQDAVALALAGNPGLAEIKARAEAMAAIPSQAGTLPDPSLNFDALNIPSRNFNLRREDMTMLEVGFSQAIPFPGKLGLREKAATFEAEAAVHSVEEARLRLARDVKAGWWQLFYFDRALGILADTQGLFQQLVEITQTKYKVGQGLQQDVLLARLELSKLSDQKVELMRMRHSEAGRLNALLNRPSETPLQLPEEAEVEQPDVASANRLQERAEQTRPLFAQRRKAIDAAQTRVDLAHKDFYPDFSVGAGYAFRQDTPSGQERSDFANFRLSLSVPIYAGSKQAKAVDQRQKELLQETYTLQDEIRRVQADITQGWADYMHARERLALFDHDIIPQAQQTVESMLAGYQVNQVDFLNLIRAEITLFDYQIQYWQALTRTQQALAQLIAATGEEKIDD